MNTGKTRNAFLAVVFCAASGFGLAACDTGTDAGDTNKEDSGIRYPEDNVKQSSSTRDTAGHDHHYDHADHPDSTAIGDGAYNQEGKRNKRP